MPFHEFKCTEGHVTEIFFRNFASADATPFVECSVCQQVAEKIISAPLPAMMFGSPDGYSNPSSLKRYSTKLSSHGGN